MTETTIGYDEVEKIWRAKKLQPIYDFNCSVGQIIYNHLRNHATNVIQICDVERREVTQRQALFWGISMAKQLHQRYGLDHNDIVGIAATNTTYVLAVQLGCFFNATPFHAVNPDFPEDMYREIFGVTRPKVIFCDGTNYENIAESTKSFKPHIYTLTAHIEGVPKVEDLLLPLPPEILMVYDPEPVVYGGYQTMAIQCSSGTTGMPKAVCLSNYRLISTMSFLTNDDVVYSPSTLDWGTGLQISLMSLYFGVKRIITTEHFTVQNFVKLVREHKITLVFLAYFQVHSLINADAEEIADSLSSIKYVAVIGSGISSNALQRLQKLLKDAYISLSYGFTEIGQVSFHLTDGPSNHSGKLIPGLDGKIIDDQGNHLGPNELGEICVYNGWRWNGYYRNPAATKSMQHDDLWFHTGDIGYFDDEQQLHVVDRKKETRKYQGHQYWPSEIEDVIDELPGLIDACVVSIADGINGDAAAAACVKRPRATLSEQDVKDYVTRRLKVPFKQLHAGVWFFDKLPYNNNGKKLKQEVANLIMKRSKAS